MGTEPPEIMNLRECAEYLGVHWQTLRRKAKAGIIPGFQIGRRWRFRKVDVDAWTRRQYDPQQRTFDLVPPEQ